MKATLRHLHAVRDPFGLYFRPGHNGHVALEELLLEQPQAISGALLTASSHDVQESLRRELRKKRYEAVLDPQTIELAFEPSFERPRMQRLRWAGKHVHRPDDLRYGGGRQVTEAIAKHAVEKGYSATLSASHYIVGPDDPWFEVDIGLTAQLRKQLDTYGGDSIPIYYSLAVHSKCLREEETRQAIVQELSGLDIDAVLLRVHPFGYDAGPISLRRYVDACRDFHQLDVPIIADRTGAAGVALLAFGAIGGMVSGMAIGEKFDANRMAAPLRPDAKPTMAPRVYIESLGSYLSRERAETFFGPENKTKSKFGCRDKGCCRRGVQDMIENPRRHFFNTRVEEVKRLSDVPVSARPNLYMNDFLRPATDKAVIAAKVEPSLNRARKQLEGWRQTLGAMESKAIRSRSRVPRGRRIRRAKLRALPSS